MKSELRTPASYWLEEKCHPCHVDGFMIPLPREAERLPPVEHGVFPPEVPVLFGP